MKHRSKVVETLPPWEQGLVVPLELIPVLCKVVDNLSSGWFTTEPTHEEEVAVENPKVPEEHGLVIVARCVEFFDQPFA